MNKIETVNKLLALAGDNPTTPEQKEAYSKAKKLLDEILKHKPVSGFIGGAPAKKPPFLKSLFETVKGVLPNRIETLSWDKLFKREPDDFVTYKITPTPSVRNNQAYVIAKVIASFYRSPSELRRWGEDGTLLKIRSPYRCNFRIIMKANSVNFYLLLPRDKSGEVLRKAEAIYDSGITIEEVPPLKKLDPEKVFCTELGYRKHDIFSLDTDRNNNYPLPSLLTAVRTLEGEDVAIFDAMFEPYQPLSWYKESKKAHNLLEKGRIPDNSPGGKILRSVHSAFESARYEILELTRFTKKQKEELEKWRKEQSSYMEAARARSEMTHHTKRKQGDDVLNTWIRIAVQSDNPERAKQTAYTLANSWKDITGDNELERHDVPKKWSSKYVDAIETRKGFSIRMRANKFSVEEAGKLLQLPGKELIEEFPQIDSKKTREIDLPDEITRQDIKRVRFGTVTVRGQRFLVGQPLQGWKAKDGHEGMSTKAVYDALCTTTFSQGKQGSGKSEGFGTVWAYDMVMAGFSSIIIDTADGQVLRNFVNSLPENFPDEKLHLLNIDNKAWPIPLGWDDIYGRNFAGSTGDEELAALEISERLTARFVGFINSLSATGEFTDRMKQYVISCMRAITTKPGWAFLDLELALTSLSYRAELLEREEVRVMPEVVADLNSLQEKALEGKEKVITDPILSRIKSLAATPFMENLFYQPPKLTDKGKPVLDLRRIMDNPEGGYGHVVCIQASFDAWQEYQGVILGFVDDKINFNAFSRIDTDQAKRKPCLKWIDEPHKIIRYLEDRLSGTAVEFRKYRVKQLLTNHSIEQMGTAANALLDGGAQVTSYKTERLTEISKYIHMFKPYEKAKELYDALPEKHVAVNAIRLPSGKPCPAFIAEMEAPPKFVMDRSYAWQASAEKYGRHWKEVREKIQGKRVLYQQKDAELLVVLARAEEEAKEAEKEAKEAAREAKRQSKQEGMAQKRTHSKSKKHGKDSA